MKAIAAKILAVRDAIGVVKKGRDNNQNFMYQKWDDVFHAVWDACDECKVIIVSRVTSTEYLEAAKTSSGKQQFRATVEIETTIVDTESGESIAVPWSGEAIGADDKILQKAITSACKYCYLKTFGIPFEDVGHDTDGVNPDVGPAPKAKAKPAPKPEPEPPVYDAAGFLTTLELTKEDKAHLLTMFGDNRPKVLRAAWVEGVSDRESMMTFADGYHCQEAGA
jgi:hypothetical protein